MDEGQSQAEIASYSNVGSLGMFLGLIEKRFGGKELMNGKGALERAC